ncbi:amino acid adenylation domain-containing protein [Streptomyces sp. LN785]|uniref:non-ribosomal peptide synthetase n=1 Tax=Streptomyces sp. LN785 TaxID=3112983 RepID=UPI0037120BE3
MDTRRLCSSGEGEDAAVSIFPASRAQRRMFFLEEISAGAPNYHTPVCYRLSGEVDEIALCTAAQGLVDRHEALRTRFAVHGGDLVQVVARAERLTWTVTDVRSAETARAWSDAETHRWIHDESSRVFDLREGPLFRVALLRRSDTERVLLLNLHHIVVDGWSLRVLLDEMARGYELALAGRPDDQEPPQFQYADYSEWQEEWLTGPAARQQEAYWREQLAGDLPVIRHPAARKRRPADGPRPSAVHRFSLAGDAARRLTNLCARTNSTVFTALLGAFDVLLGRYTGLDDIVVGVPVANRHHEEFENTVGLFVNTTVIRADLSADPTFTELLATLQGTVLDAQENQDIPFERLADLKGAPQDSATPPVFQVMFAMHHGRDQTWALPGVDVTELMPDVDTAKFDLLFDAVQTAEGVDCTLEYRSDVLTPDTMELFAEHYCRLVESVVHTPDAPVSALRVLTDAEYERWVPEPVTPTAADRPCQELFAEWARRTPDAPAVTFHGQDISYAELDRRSNRVAHLLRSLGVGPDVLVGLGVERSPELLVGILGILKAGGCYVPLDPAYPAERLQYMAEDSGLGIMLTDGAAAARWTSFAGRVVDLSRDAAEIAGWPDSPPGPCTAPEDLAYVIYTSGSTGRPKGVPVPHRNITRLFSATRPWFGFGPDDVWTLFHSYAFDFSVWEIWGALAHGGRLVVVDHETSRTPAAFHRLVTDQRVTVLNQTPSAFAQFSRADAVRMSPSPPLALRHVVFGGEALEPGALRDWFTRHGDTTPRLVNMYGITETTVHVTYRPITLADLEAERGSVIGVAIPDLRLYVLDRWSRPVPTGATGELHVGGEGLARGYLNRPELTAERFVQNPFAPGTSDRLYRTGDIVRVLPDGELEYRGRMDNQVKLRGFRIELGEIEAALTEHDRVAAAAVLLRQDPEGHPYLAAYVVRGGTSEDGGPLDDVLRAHLAGRLPDYMVPAVFNELDAFPLTANGKTDKAALPDPRRAAATAERPHTPPRTDVERRLAEIWSRTLGHSRVGIDDTYLSLGGDSIRSIQLMAAAHEAGLGFSLTDLLGRQTIRRLAEVTASLDPAPSAHPEREPFALLSAADRERLPEGLDDAYPMTRLQLGMVFHSDLSDSGTGQYHNAWHYRLSGPCAQDAWRAAVAAVCERHEILRTSFALDGFGEPMQRVHRRVEPPITFEDLRLLPEAERDAAVAARFDTEMSTPFSWTRPPLVRFHVQRLTEDTFELFVVEHHAVLDGWSERSLFVELLSRYSQALTGRPALATEPLSYRFRDFVEEERAAVADPESAAFWSELLDGFTFAPVFGPAHREGAARQPRMAFSHRPVPVELGRAVRELADRLDVPLRTVLLAAHLRVMSVVGGARDVVTGAVYNGRGEVRDADKCLGLFLNTLPIRAHMADGTWTELIRETARVDNSIQRHRRYPMSEIRRRTGRPELFDTYFNYTHFHVEQTLTDESAVEVLDSTGAGDTSFGFGAAFSVDSATGELSFGMRYDAERHQEEQIEALRGRYESALTQMVRAPDSRYASTSLLSAAEQRAVEAWSGTAAAPAPPAATLTGLFTLAAREHRHATAVVHGEERLDHGRLDALSTRLARVLRQAGVGPDRLVAVCLDDSVGLVVAILAVLKAGGAYVPLDPDQPPARLESLLADADPLVLVTDRAHGGRLSGHTGPRVLIDGVAGLWEPGDDEPPLPESSGRDHLAYVIYTSGSTGRPKGVAVQHGEIVAYLSGLSARLGVCPGAGYGLSQSLAFDFSMTMLYLSLTTGGTLHLLPRHLTDDELAAAVRSSGIDYLKLTPSHLSALAATLGAGRLLPRRALILGGEASAQGWAADLAAQGGCAVFNHYGPTEATVGVTVHQVTADRGGGASTPIGRPLPGARVHVLDDSLQPVPPGTVGELYLGGERLARGYLGRAALTAERFVADPFGPAGARLYRSGDLARRLPDGSLCFLGRRDHQVKIRGHRVELGEIEAALRELPGVAQAVAVAHPTDRPQQLVAYLEPSPGTRLWDARELRDRMRQRLPEHLVPSRFITLDRLPLQSHGKADRGALPAPDAIGTGQDQVREAPATVWEQTVADLWSDLLGVDRFGVTDDFFELGGDSLLATQMVARLRRALPDGSTTIRVRDLFTHRTVRTVAALVAGPATDGGPRPTTDATDAHGHVFLPSARQQGLWFLDQQQGPSSTYNVPTAVWLEGALDLEALRLALTDVVARHETLRSVFEVREGDPLLRILEPAVDGVELPLLSVAEAEVPTVLARLGDTPFDLAVDRPFRAHLLKVAPERHLLLLVIHHVATDGASRGALFRDLGTAYAARREGRALGRRPLPVRYADHAVRQRQFLGDPAAPDSEAARQVGYWKATLAGLPEEVGLPTDHPRPAAPSHRGVTHRVTCPAEVHARLRDLAGETGTTLFMLLQAATAALLTRLGAGHDVALGVPVDGRADEGLEELVGFFVNTVVLRTHTNGDPTFRELLGRVRETDIAAWAHQDVPFDWVVEALNPERSSARNPLFQVLMTVQDDNGGSLDLPGLVTRAERVETDVAKFDLSFGFSPRRTETGAPDELVVAVGGSADLYEAETVQAVAERMALLLAAIAKDADLPLTEIELLQASERRQMSAEWSGRAATRPTATLVELFDAQVARRPAAVAVVSDGKSVSYGKLDTMAARLARVLAGRGVRPGSSVAVLLDRSVELLAATLAVLRSGAICVPIDPSSSAEDIATLLAGTEPDLVLVATATSGAPASTPDRPLVALDRLDGEDGAGPAEAVAGACTDTGSGSAYVLRTSSGAGGLSVGVTLTHDNVVAALQADDERFGFGGDDVWSWSHSPASALSVWEMWGALARGGTLVVVSAGTSRSPEEFLRLLERERVTVLCGTPAEFHPLAHADARLSPALALRTVALHEEEDVDAGPLDVWFARHPGNAVRLVRMRGVGDTGCPVLYTMPDGATGSAGLRAFVLDDSLRLLPPGVVGELHVVGPQLAQDHSYRPEPGTARSMPCPFEPGQRMFRTGHLARWTSEGRLQCTGRVNEQVRLHGFRVDLGAVRAELARHPKVARATVSVREDEPGERRLVAYAVPADAGVTAAELQARLRERLAGHLVPDVVLLEELPRTVDGRLDRRALPAATPAAGKPSRAAVGTGLEKELCSVMAEILDVPEVGVHHNFFALGGHSLLAVRFLARVKDLPGADRARLTIRDLYRCPTVAQLAEHLGSQVRSNPMEPVLTMREGSGEPLFCLPAISGLSWAFSAILPHIDASHPVVGLQSEQLRDPSGRPLDFDELVTAHVARIREVQQHGPFHLMGWSFGGVLAHAVAARLDALGEQVATLALLDARPLPRRRPTTVDRHWALGVLLGHEAKEFPEPATDEELVAVLRANDPVLGMLDPHQVAAVVATTMDNRRAFLSHHVENRFSGDLLFFNAERTGRLSGKEAWTPYVCGEIREYDVDCGHMEMTQREPLATIGRIIDGHLRERSL